MQTVTILKREYQGITERQMKIEKELRVVKEMLRCEISEEYMRPEILARWEKISRDLDRGKGHAFSSVSQMRSWLKR